MQDNAGNDILQLPEKIAIEKGIQIVICIDEFQQISDFEDSKNISEKATYGVATTAACLILPFWK